MAKLTKKELDVLAEEINRDQRETEEVAERLQQSARQMVQRRK